MNKQYLISSLKSNFKTILTILIISLFYPVILLTTKFNEISTAQGPYVESSNIGYVLAFLGILCYIIPLFKSSYLLKKNKVDTFYSLPIKRVTLLNTNLLVGFIEIIIPYTLSYFLGFFIILNKDINLNYEYYIPLYFVSIAIALILYVFNFFIASRANNGVDSIILIILYTFVIALVFQSVATIINQTSRALKFETLFSPTNFITFVPLVQIGNYYDILITNKQMSGFNLFFLYLVVFGLICILCYIGLILSCKFDKAERCEQISTSYFAYKVLIPVYYFSFISWMVLSSTADNVLILLFIILVVCAYIGYIIYCRKFILKLPIYIILLSGILLFVLCLILI